MSDYLLAVYFLITGFWIWFTVDSYRGDRRNPHATARDLQLSARAVLLAPLWPLGVLWVAGLLLRVAGTELGRRTPNVGRAIGDLMLDAKGRSVDE